MIPYTKNYTLVVAQDGDIKTLDFFSRGIISRIAVVRLGTGAVAVDIYNRAFTSAAANIKEIVNDGNNFTKLLLWDSMLVRVGDVITVASTAVGGYNSNPPTVVHRVTAILPDQALQPDGVRTIVTSVAYSADSAGGTATLAIPAAEQTLSHVTDQLTGTTTVEKDLDVSWMNNDPLPNANTGIARKIYLKFASADTYRVSLMGLATSMTGG
jgi:hypothetical protein